MTAALISNTRAEKADDIDEMTGKRDGYLIEGAMNWLGNVTYKGILTRIEFKPDVWTKVRYHHKLNGEPIKLTVRR